ncbi:alanine dehydrogenase [Colidextribacter sp. OB.20]|uniref:alanine dehydrogenase n=1 Tax=Colidextribacter sp. OB.20 TaxID=2304568 RepID=UPI00136DEEC5|nr:alanine dehydrogenase [Colidextribacter sp. OB.20]NBI11563.1 alanine dehydrogenase [Colidextribacter sp. OB.20]
MIIGLPKEIKNNEFRVGLTPGAVSAYVRAGNTVLVEQGAGQGSGFSDQEYLDAGARIEASAADVWAQAGMIVKVKEPIECEYLYFRKGMLLYTYLHLAADEPLTRALLESEVDAVAYETIAGREGGLPCLAPMSEIAGRMAVQEGAKYLEKTYGGRGVLLAGVPGVEKGNVVILGGGNVGTNACKIALGMGANVTVLDVNLHRLAYLDDIFDKRLTTLYSTRENIRRAAAQADLVVGAVLLPGRAAPKLLLREDLHLMKPGAVIVDVAVDQGGCVETTRATTHDDPVFIVDGIVHYCVANMPGAVARTSTLALVNATLPYGLELAARGLEACKAGRGLLAGLNCCKGRCTFPGVAEALGLAYTDPATLI